jgi:hypothetical protein
VQRHQPGAPVAERQWPQNQRVQHAVDDRVGADAEGQGHYRGERKAAGPTQGAEGEPDILKHASQKASTVPGGAGPIPVCCMHMEGCGGSLTSELETASSHDRTRAPTC